MTGDAESRNFEMNRARALKSRAFRWTIFLILDAMLAAGSALLELIPFVVGYWLALGCGLGSIGTTIIYFVAHGEVRE